MMDPKVKTLVKESQRERERERMGKLVKNEIPNIDSSIWISAKKL